MNIYCITPVYDPNIEYLKQNIKSVKSQTIPVKHMLVFDGPKGLAKAKEHKILIKQVYT